MASSQQLVSALKASAEPTRLRLLALLAHGELNVKDLTRILGQSQPRLSRHLKLLVEAGLIERAAEGSWAYFRLPVGADTLSRTLLAELDPADPVLARDRQRLDAVKREREANAQEYFRSQAADWDRVRALHVAEASVENAMRAALGNAPVDLFVDIGTGTGRILELFADHYKRGLGFDLNTAMLAYARQKLDRAGLTQAQVRQGDIYDLPLADHVAGTVVMHQILHFLSDPARAIAEAARLVAPAGKLLIVDFAPHALEFLRDIHKHERLGFESATVTDWLAEAGLHVVATKALPPPGKAATEHLTVSLWLAERAGPAPGKSASRPTKSALERTA